MLQLVFVVLGWLVQRRGSSSSATKASPKKPNPIWGKCSTPFLYILQSDGETADTGASIKLDMQAYAVF